MGGETAGAEGPPVSLTYIGDCQREMRDHPDKERRKNEQKSDKEDIQRYYYTGHA